MHVGKGGCVAQPDDSLESASGGFGGPARAKTKIPVSLGDSCGFAKKGSSPSTRYALTPQEIRNFVTPF